MLQGKRMFTDAEIEEVATEALTVFDSIVNSYNVADDLRQQVFGLCVGMVGERDITAELLAARMRQGQPLQ